MAQPWHVSRGGARGRASSKQWPGRGPHRANVWTPSTATVTTTTAAAAGPASATVVSASSPPALTARTSSRKAADLVEAASTQSASEIEAYLKEAEERLAIAVAQEAEVRAIADEHLEREAYLTKLLQDLYRHHREEQQGGASSSPQDGPAVLTANADPVIDLVNTASPSGGSSSEKAPAAPAPAAPAVAVTRGLAIRDAATAAAAAATRGLAVQDAPAQALPEPDPAALPPPKIPKSTVSATKAPVPTALSAPTESGGGVSVPRRQATSQRVGGRGGVTAAATDGSEPDPNLLLAMAIGGGMVPGGDDLLTRDARTIAEYIRLMSFEVLGEEAQGRDRPVERWHQTGLSLTEALDKAEATAARPARLPNLLALAAAIRPVDSSAATAAGGGRTSGGATTAPPSGGTKRKRRDDAGNSPGTAAATAAAGGEPRAGAPGAKRRRVDANAIMCPFELNGVCNDDDCRYQHLDVYLRPSLNPGTSPAPNAASAAANGQPAKPSASDPGGASPVPGPLAAAAAAAAAARTDERPSALGQHRLPAIDFTGAAKRDAVARARDSGRRGVVKPSSTRQPSSETGGGMPTAAEGGTADQAGVGGGNASGELEEAEAVDSGEETTSVDGEEEEEDFLALPTERAENNGGDGGEASSETAAAATPEQASPAVLAKAFALAASGASASGGPGNVVRGAGGSGVGREERYYPEGGDGKTQGAASAALPDDQLSALEAQLNEGASCDVEGWLLLAMHQLPRTGGSVKAVLNTISDVACGASGPMGSVDQAAIKTALRTFVQPLERAEGGQAEVLWLLYLRLFAFLPGKSEDALGMAEYALEKFPTSRRIWRLYRSMLQTSPGWSLSEDVSCYRRQIEALLLLQPRAADMRASPRDGSSSGGGGPGAKATSSGSLGKNKSGDGGTGGTGGGGGGAEANVKMIVYLVLERCSLLAEAGYKLQAAAEILDSLGALAEGQPLWGWDARDGQGRRTLLRTSEGGGHEREGEGGGARREGGGTKAGGSTEASDDDGQRLPAGVAAALKHAPRDSRCVLWLTALHLLVMGVFPHHVLTLAENDCGGLGGSNDTTAAGGGLADLLLWPAEWLSPKSSAILRLSASPDLQDATLKTFMTALSDVGLLPPPRSKGCWAPAIKDRDALLSSAAEAKAARAGGMAPDASALEGPPLVLALNWLAFCLRRGRVDARQGRMMAFACCRRFQLSRPDQPALLEHFLLEHAVSKTRTLGDTYHEISRAFDADGVAAGALRERRDGEGKSASFNPAGARSRNEQSVNLVPPPSGERIQAVYAFLRFVESRLEAARSESESESESANDAGRGALEDARRVLRDALVGMWMGAAAAAASAAGGGAARSDSDRWLEEEGGESVRRALEGAKASLFRWADGGSGGCDAPGGNGERQLSTIVFSLWVLGGASAAIGSLDHILSAESFSGVSAERKRLAWLQRLEAAMILSTQQQQKQQASGVDAMQGVREVALRALADHRTERRAGYPSLAHFVAATLDRPPATESPVRDSSCQPGKSLSRYTPSAPLATDSAASSSSFACDVLTVYANHFREARRGGVDWVVAAEALGGVSAAAAAAAHASCAALALLRWVSWADHDESGAVTAASLVDGASALKANARPYVEMALAMNPADTALCGAVAALWAATGSPDLAQRVLEAALRAHPYCAELWEQRVALEAGFGSGSTERAGATAAAAAGSRVMLRLRCGGKLGGQTPSGLQARTAGRIATAISHPPSRRETKSFSLQAALRAPPGSSAPVAAAAMATIEVPRSIFLMTSLTSLSLAFNGLLSVPAAIGSLSVLRSLDVSGNALASLPQSLSRLSGTLRLLRAAGNRLQSPLSAATPIGDLVGLRVLDLENNELSNFPGVVVPTLTQLRSLKLAGNEFSERAPAGLSDALPFLEELSLPSLA